MVSAAMNLTDVALTATSPGMTARQVLRRPVWPVFVLHLTWLACCAVCCSSSVGRVQPCFPHALHHEVAAGSKCEPALPNVPPGVGVSRHVAAADKHWRLVGSQLHVGEPSISAGNPTLCARIL